MSPDEVLATQRGGIRLPNGIDAAWSVNTTTAVNGAVVLQTIVRVDQGGLQVSPPTRRAMASGSPAPTRSRRRVGGAEPRLTYDSRTGISVRQTPATGISVSSGSSGDAGHALAGPGAGRCVSRDDNSQRRHPPSQFRQQAPRSNCRDRICRYCTWQVTHWARPFRIREAIGRSTPRPPSRLISAMPVRTCWGRHSCGSRT